MTGLVVCGGVVTACIGALTPDDKKPDAGGPTLPDGTVTVPRDNGTTPPLSGGRQPGQTVAPTPTATLTGIPGTPTPSASVSPPAASIPQPTGVLEGAYGEFRIQKQINGTGFDFQLASFVGTGENGAPAMGMRVAADGGNGNYNDTGIGVRLKSFKIYKGKTLVHETTAAALDSGNTYMDDGIVGGYDAPTKADAEFGELVDPETGKLKSGSYRSEATFQVYEAGKNGRTYDAKLTTKFGIAGNKVRSNDKPSLSLGGGYDKFPASTQTDGIKPVSFASEHTATAATTTTTTTVVYTARTGGFSGGLTA